MSATSSSPASLSSAGTTRISGNIFFEREREKKRDRKREAQKERLKELVRKIYLLRFYQIIYFLDQLQRKQLKLDRGENLV